METIINVDDVSFSYGTQTEQALSHISLSVNKGDFIASSGPSGAGKSTLSACLSGARAPPLHRHVLWVRHG